MEPQLLKTLYEEVEEDIRTAAQLLAMDSEVGSSIAILWVEPALASLTYRENLNSAESRLRNLLENALDMGADLVIVRS